MKLLRFFILFIMLSTVFYSLYIRDAQANIVLKLIAANPSEDTEQPAQIKAYLPKETKPEDVLDKGGLDIAYDTQQGSYYLFGEFMLKPQELLEKDIELRDIWVIPDSEIESIKLEAAKFAGAAKGTEFVDRVSYLLNGVDTKLNQIVDNQKNSPANPERHISDYRDNLKSLESVKADLALVRSLISQIKAMPSAMLWRLIVAIIIFLGLMGLVFYFIWSKQLKNISQDTFFTPEKDAALSSVGPTINDGDDKGKKVEMGDIEKMLKDQGEENKR